MRASAKVVSSLFVVLGAMIVACSSSSSSGSSTSSSSSSSSSSGGSGDGGGGGNVYCTVPPRDAGALSTPKGCFIFHNVSSGVDETPACSSKDGTITSSCPTDGLFGCCTLPNGRTEQCYYDETDAGAQVATAACSALKGTWTTTM